MSFCSFSKDFNENAYTLIENQFITKYLPAADGFVVKVYLYGLYLCQNADADFSLLSLAEVLKTDREKIEEAFEILEDYDLVQILSRDPFLVNYLPVRSALGRPKRVHYEQYGDFNKELQRKMQSVGKFVSYNDSVKYMRFLEENTIEPQAFLLIADYCIRKQGESVSPSYIFNKAKKFIKNGWVTFERVERELSNCNAHESDVAALFTALGIFKKPDENDYALYEKWLLAGFEKSALSEAAKRLKRGNFESLDTLLSELSERGKLTGTDVTAYLTEREMLAAITFRVGRKLGVKVGNPAPYIDEYTEKWYNCGYEEPALLNLALFCMKTERGDFSSMNELVKELFAKGIVTSEGVEDYLKEKNAQLRLFMKIQGFCGNLKKSPQNLSLIDTWRSWSMTDELILEAAKHAAGSANPIPYMNKILSDWKRVGITAPEQIPTKDAAPAPTARPAFKNPAVEAIDEKSARERHYAILREQAQARADKYTAKANENPEYKQTALELKRLEISLGKAEVLAPETVPELKKKKNSLLEKRRKILAELGIEEAQLAPQYQCKRCLDTGYLPSGIACGCYKENKPQGVAG